MQYSHTLTLGNGISEAIVVVYDRHVLIRDGITIDLQEAELLTSDWLHFLPTGRPKT